MKQQAKPYIDILRMWHIEHLKNAFKKIYMER